MLIYTGCYICLLVMIVFKGRKLIKGRKMDSSAAQGCSLKAAAAATPSPVLTLKGPRGWPACPSAGWWPKPISSATDSLCALSHIPAPRFPLCGVLGTSFPFPGLACAHHTPPTALAASAGAFGGFYPSPLGVQKVSMFNGLFQADLI